MAGGRNSGSHRTRNRVIAVAPDGQSFSLVRQGASGDRPSELIVVQNWFQELEAKMKAGK
jgi:hypothetical protein